MEIGKHPQFSVLHIKNGTSLLWNTASDSEISEVGAIWILGIQNDRRVGKLQLLGRSENVASVAARLEVIRDKQNT